MATVRELINLIGFKVDKTQMTKANQLVTGFKNKMVAFGKIMAASILAIGAFAVKAAADMESLTAEFKVMLGSAELANKMVGDLTQFAAKTPFQVKDLAETTRTLLQFGVAADDIMPTLNMLGDVAGKNSQRLTSLSFAFGKVKSQGRLTGLELKQMIIAGFNPLQVLYEKTGESVDSLRKRMSSGNLKFDEVVYAFKIATSEGGKFYKNMEEQSKTFLGLLSTMKDNITLALAEIGKKLLPVLSQVVMKITELFQGSLGELLGTLIGFIEPLLNNIMPLLDSIITVLNPFINQLAGALMPIIAKVLEILTKILEPLLRIVVAVLTPWLTLLEQIMPIIDEVMTIFEELVYRILEDLAPFTEEWVGLLSDVLKLMMPIIRIFLKLFLTFVRLAVIIDTAIIKILLKGLTAVLKVLRPIIELFNMFFIPVFEKIEEVMDAIGFRMRQTVYDVASGIIQFMNQIFKIINTIVAKINEIPFIKEKLKSLQPLDEDKLLKEITGDTINNNANNKNTEINFQQQFNINGAQDPNATKRIIGDNVRSTFAIELKKVLLSSEGL